MGYVIHVNFVILLSASIATAEKEKKKPPSSSTLEKYAKERWEGVLQYIAQVAMSISSGIKSLLEWSELVKKYNIHLAFSHCFRDANSESYRITREGFQFLLQDTKTQIWTLLREYVDTAPKRNQQKVEVIQFLFELSFLEPGKAYSVDVLTLTQRAMLMDLAEFGLVYQRKAKSHRFYPTHLAIGVVSDQATSWDWGNRGAGYIALETNFRLYAYTENTLQVAILSLFLTLEYRLPNVIVGLLTKDSVQTALMNGITADQVNIIAIPSYLLYRFWDTCTCTRIQK